MDEIRNILDVVAPVKNIQPRRNYINWIDHNLKDLMNDRDNKREVARTTGEPADWQDYRRTRNICTKELDNTKNKYYREMFATFEKENDNKNIYRTARNLLCWKRNSQKLPSGWRTRKKT